MQQQNMSKLYNFGSSFVSDTTESQIPKLEKSILKRLEFLEKMFFKLLKENESLKQALAEQSRTKERAGSLALTDYADLYRI